MPRSSPRILHAPESSLFLNGEPVWAVHPDGPRYGQEVWDCQAVVQRESQSERRIDLRLIPDSYRTTSTHLLMILAQPDHPRVVEVGVIRRARPAPVATVYSHYLRLRVLASWGLDRRHRSFAAWTQRDADDLLDDLRLGRHRQAGDGLRGGVRGYVQTLKLLREYAVALPGGLSFQPWGARSAAHIAGEVNSTENRTPPLPWATFGSTIAAAWAFVDRFSLDILAAVDAARSLPSEARGAAGGNAWKILTAWASTGTMPLHTGFGRSPGERGEPNVKLLCRMLRIRTTIFRPSHHAFRQQAVDLVTAMAANPHSSAYGGLHAPTVTVIHEDGTTSLWIDEIGLGETEYLASALRAACYVILGSLTGMRDGECRRSRNSPVAGV